MCSREIKAYIDFRLSSKSFPSAGVFFLKRLTLWGEKWVAHSHSQSSSLRVEALERPWLAGTCATFAFPVLSQPLPPTLSGCYSGRRPAIERKWSPLRRLFAFFCSYCNRLRESIGLQNQKGKDAQPNMLWLAFFMRYSQQIRLWLFDCSIYQALKKGDVIDTANGPLQQKIPASSLVKHMNKYMNWIYLCWCRVTQILLNCGEVQSIKDLCHNMLF